MRAALIRHPPVLAPQGLCYGRLDLPLHPDSLVECARIAQAVAGFGGAILWSSPARRCQAVAQAIAVQTGLVPRADARLRELDFGAWEGRLWNDVPRDKLDPWAADPLRIAPPGGESGAALLARVVDFHASLVAAGQDAIIVSHAGPLKLLGALLAGTAPDILARAPALGSVQIIACSRHAARHPGLADRAPGW